MLMTFGREVCATVQPHDAIDFVNAISTVVMAGATVALTVFAGLQIKHRGEDRRDQARRLDAVASYHAWHLRRALQDAVTGLDALRLHDRTLGSWRQQATKVFNFFVVAARELEQIAGALIERHAGTPAAVEELLSAALAGFDAARELAGPVAQGMSEEIIRDLTATARQEAMTCLTTLHVKLHLPVAQSATR
jgi:hypothetical protein